MLANNLMESSLDRGEMHEKFTVAYDQLIKCAFFSNGLSKGFLKGIGYSKLTILSLFTHAVIEICMIFFLA